jgi:hypothetical protein
MKFFLLFFSFVIFQEDLPFKPKEEYDIKLNFEFRQRPSQSNTSVNFEERGKGADSKNAGPLPYIHVLVNVLQRRPDEARIKVVNNLESTLLSKKLDKVTSFTLDLGFTDDLKDHVSAHEFTIYFLSAEKLAVRKIVISFDEDGNYFVNGEKRGKV